MLKLEKELKRDNDFDYQYKLDRKFYKLKYPKLKHFEISVSISKLFQPIEYNDDKDIEIIFYNDTCKNCNKFILDINSFIERDDYILNHDKIIRHLIYNNYEFDRNYFYEGIYKLDENKFRISFGT
jgi:hypothetical protein